MPDGLTLTLALYGAILSTITIYWLWRDRHSHIRILLYTSIGPAENGVEKLIALHVQNVGAKPVMLTSAGFMFPNKHLYWASSLFGTGPDFPHEILPGQNYILHAPLETLVNVLRKDGMLDIITLRGFGESAIGERFRGGKLQIDLESGNLISGNGIGIWALIDELNKG